jgi:hypothetical protein
MVNVSRREAAEEEFRLDLEEDERRDRMVG